MGRPRGLAPNGPEIRRLRVDLGLTADQLAARLGCNPRTLSAWESEYRRISDVTASRLARVLGVSMRAISDYAGDDGTGSELETPGRLSA